MSKYLCHSRHHHSLNKYLELVSRDRKVNSFPTTAVDEGCNSLDVVGSLGVEIFIRTKSRKKGGNGKSAQLNSL